MKLNGGCESSFDVTMTKRISSNNFRNMITLDTKLGSPAPNKPVIG